MHLRQGCGLLGIWILSTVVTGSVALATGAPSPDEEVAAASPVVGGAVDRTLDRPVGSTVGPATTVPAPPPSTTAPPIALPAASPPTVAEAPAPTSPPATTSPEPGPAPADQAPADPGAGAPATSDPVQYALSLVAQVVPPRWLAAVPVEIVVIPGNTSWSSYGGLIEIGDWHLFDSEVRARFILAHEWGHQAAWAFGPDTYDGEPPRGFPVSTAQPEEEWGDCVGQVLSGAAMGTCSGAGHAFTAAWLAAGPPR